jgi:hypothetical protein
VRKRFRATGGVAVLIMVLVTTVVAGACIRESATPTPSSGGANSLPTEKPTETPEAADTEPRTSRSIQEAKEAWEARLMAMPGVTGVAIGLSKDGRTPCIKVYVNRFAVRTATEIPKEIEGYPVEVERRGVFRPRQ